MTKNAKKIFLILFWALVLFAIPVYALEITYPQLPGGISFPEEPELNQYVRYIYAFSIFIAGLIAFGTFIYGGILYLVSQGNPLRMSNARDWIGSGFLGIIILLASYLILFTINPQLVGLKEIKFETETVPEVILTEKLTPEQKDLAFKIPLGKIIDEVILSDETGSELKDLEKIAEEVTGLINTLNPALFELKQLIDSCNCGVSQCAEDCAPQGCQLNCDLAAIHAKADEIKNSPILSEFEKKESKIAELRRIIGEKLLNLYKAVFLTTILYDEIRDYFTFVIERDVIAQSLGRKIEIETLPEWEDISILIKTPDGRTIADPATFYFWRTYEEMQKAIDFADSLNSDYIATCPGMDIPHNVICEPSQPGTLIMPAQGIITQKFGVPNPEYATGYHAGIDIANSLGTPILAAVKGEVIAINQDCGGTCEDTKKCGGSYGNWILIHHPDLDIYTLYAHLNEVFVTPGDTVKQGQQIGTMGWTGWSVPKNEGGTHLHFSVLKGKVTFSGAGCFVAISPSNNFVDPLTYITGESVCGPGGGGGGGKCEVVTDPDNACSESRLEPYFGPKASEASQICNAESGGNIWALNDGCLEGGYDYSVGLFQINLYRTGRCDAMGIPESEIFIEISPSTCQWANPITSPIKAEQCAEAYGLGNADLNSQKAAEIFNAWGNWCAWSTAHPQNCNLCPHP